jgi:hypothetical protein
MAAMAMTANMMAQHQHMQSRMSSIQVKNMHKLNVDYNDVSLMDTNTNINPSQKNEVFVKCDSNQTTQRAAACCAKPGEVFSSTTNTPYDTELVVTIADFLANSCNADKVNRAEQADQADETDINITQYIDLTSNIEQTNIGNNYSAYHDNNNNNDNDLQQYDKLVANKEQKRKSHNNTDNKFWKKFKIWWRN